MWLRGKSPFEQVFCDRFEFSDFGNCLWSIIVGCVQTINVPPKIAIGILGL